MLSRVSSFSCSKIEGRKKAMRHRGVSSCEARAVEDGQWRVNQTIKPGAQEVWSRRTWPQAGMLGPETGHSSIV
jgi:hypothetical protein